MRNSFIKDYRLEGAAVSLGCFVLYMTGPFIVLRSFKEVSPLLFSIADMAGIAVLIGTLHVFKSDKWIDRSLKYLRPLLVIETGFWIALAFISYHYMEYRYFLLSVLMPLFCTPTDVALDTIINRNLSGDTLTRERISRNKIKNIGSLCGGTIAVLFLSMDMQIGLGTALLCTQIAGVVQMTAAIKLANHK